MIAEQDKVSYPVRIEVELQVWRQVQKLTSEQAVSQVWGQVGRQLEEQLWAQVRRQVSLEVYG